MTVARLQAALDQVLVTTRQRLLLMLLAIVAITSATGAIALATPFDDRWVVVAVGVLAGIVAIEPAEQLGMVLMGIVLLHWLVLDAAVTSPWTIGLALCLYVFHTVVALMAVTPHAASVHVVVLTRWLKRSGVVVVATVGVWALVYVFEQREAPGNVALSALAFGVLAAAVVGFRQRSLTKRF